MVATEGCQRGSGARESQHVVIESHSLSKSYGVTPALAGVDVSVPPGEVFGFLGPNGAGKTTFVKILLDFIRPTEGTVRVLGQEPARADRSRMGYLPERISIHPFLTAREFLEMQAALANVPAAKRKDEVARALDRVKMTESADRRIEGFSKGMMQRIGVAQAILESRTCWCWTNRTRVWIQWASWRFARSFWQRRNAAPRSS